MTSLTTRFATAVAAGAALLFAGTANAAVVSPGALAPVKSVIEKSGNATPVHFRRGRHWHRRIHRKHRRGPRIRFHYRPHFSRRARLRRRCFNRFRPIFHTYRCHRIRRAYYRRFHH